MVSRRIFLRRGGLALVSLGFAPTFLARTAAAASTRTKLLIAIFQRGAVDGLNVVVPYGERRLLPAPAVDCHSAAGLMAPTRRVDLDGFFGLPSAPRAARAAVSQRLAGRRPRVWLARQHALALRRAGLHGVGDARREEHG